MGALSHLYIVLLEKTWTLSPAFSRRRCNSCTHVFENGRGKHNEAGCTLRVLVEYLRIRKAESTKKVRTRNVVRCGGGVGA